MSAAELVNKWFKKIAVLVAVTAGIFHLLNVSGILVLSTMPIRIVHLMAMILMVFANSKPQKGRGVSSLDTFFRVILFLLSLGCSLYILFRWEGIVTKGGLTNSTDVLMGIIMIVLVLEATRRTAGWALSIITTIFLSYPFIGPYLPYIFKNRAYSVSRIFSFLFTTTEGIYGIPISVSSTYIILFCIYGSFLSEFGAGQFLFKLSSSLTKRFDAATAKTSIIFSALIGMISGSAAGNVAVTGSLTIPMMIKSGYREDKAGAISAVAATGGQIMPPIMGAAAFMMAEIIGVPYATIMKAAVIPATLFFLSIFIIVHLEARKERIDIAKDRDDAQSFMTVLKEGWQFLFPILALIVMMVAGYSPFKSAYYSIIALIVVYALSQFITEKKISFEILKKIFDKLLISLQKGAADTVPIATACAAAGIIAGVLSITGLGSKFSALIIQLSGGHLIIALLLTMLVSLILGMGLPTTAAYLVLASVIAPALVRMGLAPLPVHMFVFFFGCISTITPPVALASYVAAGIAGTELNRVGWTAFKYGLVSFILPFMFVYGPSLLMTGSTFSIITTIIFSTIGVFCIAVSVVGFYLVDLALWQRVLLFAAGILTVNQGTFTDLIGIAILAFIYITIRHQKKMLQHSNFII